MSSTLKERDTKPEVDGRDLTQLVEGNTAFALEMYANLAAANPGKNATIGPYSISQAMAMLYAGARGTTAAELRETLHFEVDLERFHQTFNGLGLELLSRDGDITLRIANQLWTQMGFRPPNEFLDVMTRDYDAPLAVLDFASDPERARTSINQWVAGATEEKIVELFPAGSIAGNTVLVLANAMYMDAPWKYQFDPAYTRPSPFTLPDGSDAIVDMMHYDEFLPSAYDPGWQAVERPYRGDEVSMIAVVPQDFAAFEASLTPARLNAIAGAIRDGGIHLSFPRFTFSFHRRPRPREWRSRTHTVRPSISIGRSSSSSSSTARRTRCCYSGACSIRARAEWVACRILGVARADFDVEVAAGRGQPIDRPRLRVDGHAAHRERSASR
jgi:serpin B